MASSPVVAGHVRQGERPMAGREALMDRDPMLMHAVNAHGGEWRPDLESTTNYASDQERGLPDVQIRVQRHQITWQTPAGRVMRYQEWMNSAYQRKEGWHATATVPDQIPETILIALIGRPLSAVIDLPGADAWIVEATARVPNFHIDLVLRRA